MLLNANNVHLNVLHAKTHKSARNALVAMNSPKIPNV